MSHCTRKYEGSGFLSHSFDKELRSALITHQRECHPFTKAANTKTLCLKLSSIIKPTKINRNSHFCQQKIRTLFHRRNHGEARFTNCVAKAPQKRGEKEISVTPN